MDFRECDKTVDDLLGALFVRHGISCKDWADGVRNLAQVLATKHDADWLAPVLLGCGEECTWKILTALLMRFVDGFKPEPTSKYSGHLLELRDLVDLLQTETELTDGFIYALLADKNDEDLEKVPEKFRPAVRAWWREVVSGNPRADIKSVYKRAKRLSAEELRQDLAEYQGWRKQDIERSLDRLSKDADRQRYTASRVALETKWKGSAPLAVVDEDSETSLVNELFRLRRGPIR